MGQATINLNYFMTGAPDSLLVPQLRYNKLKALKIFLAR